MFKITTKLSSSRIVDGAWGPWSPWAICSSTCGGGTRSRTRVCNSPRPQYGGKKCQGESKDSEACNKHDCPVGMLTSDISQFSLALHFHPCWISEMCINCINIKCVISLILLHQTVVSPTLVLEVLTALVPPMAHGSAGPALSVSVAMEHSVRMLMRYKEQGDLFQAQLKIAVSMFNIRFRVFCPIV